MYLIYNICYTNEYRDYLLLSLDSNNHIIEIILYMTIIL